MGNPSVDGASMVFNAADMLRCSEGDRADWRVDADRLVVLIDDITKLSQLLLEFTVFDSGNHLVYLFLRVARDYRSRQL